MNFLEMQQTVSGYVGQVSPSGAITGGEQSKSFTRRVINGIVEEISQSWEWAFYRTSAQVHVRVSYDTGTVTVTQGDRDITGAGTAWDASLVGQLFISGDDQIRVESVTSATAIVLAREVAHTASGAGLSYTIRRDMVDQPWDAQKIYSVRQLRYPREIASASIMGLAQGRLLYDTDSQTIRDMELDAYIRPSIYSTGTVSVAVDATTVTGVGTTWTGFDLLENDTTIVFAGESQKYPIASITNDTTLELAIPYKGQILQPAAAVVGATYNIGGDRPCMRIVDPDDESDAVIVEYEEKAFPMYRDDDVCKVPQEYHFSVICQLAGARLMAIKGMRGEARDAHSAGKVAEMQMRESASVDGTRYGVRIARVDETVYLGTIPGIDTSRRAL